MADIAVDDKEARDAAKVALRWIDALTACDRWQQTYLTRCRKIVRRYRNERGLTTTDQNNDARRFAILWSNIQTLLPAVYARTPQPIVSRRYKDPDPTGRYASEVLERSLSYSMDQYEFDDHIKLSATDFLLLARGNVWVRYVPHNMENETAASVDAEIEDDGAAVTNTADIPNEVPYAEAVCDHISYDDWGMEPCRSWDETSYVWRRVFMSRPELVERFGRKIGRAIPLDWSPSGTQSPDTAVISGADGSDRIKRAAIYEIWSKDDGKVYWINKSFPLQPLDVRDPKNPADELPQFANFFPCPRPLTGTLAPDSFIPIPDFVYYEDQAQELDELTARIGTLTDGLKLIGFYGGEAQQNLQTLFMQPSGTMVPIASMAGWTDKGGFKGMVEWMPIDQVASTLKECFEARDRIMHDIYEITGMGDIIRGESDPRETATAQALKGLWGPIRIRDKQKDIARFCRDVLRLKAEIIASRFNIKTLKAMTDIKMLDTVQQKQAIAASQQPQPQIPGAPPAPPPPPIPPQVQQLLSRPTWEEVDGLLKDRALRGFRVDVETDSTIEPNEQEEKQARVEFVTALGQYIAAVQPLLTASPHSGNMVGQIGLYLVRGFRAGREVEDAVESYFEQVAQNPPKELGAKSGAGPSDEKMAQTDLQATQIKAQAEAMKGQTAIQVAQIKAQADAQRIPIEQAQQQLEARDQQIRLVALQRDPNPQSVSNG